MEVLTRRAYRVGNSAGVVVPKEWLNGFVEVKLVAKALPDKSLTPLPPEIIVKV